MPPPPPPPLPLPAAASEGVNSGHLSLGQVQYAVSLSRLVAVAVNTVLRAARHGNVVRCLRHLETVLHERREGTNLDRGSWETVAVHPMKKVGLRLERPEREQRIRKRIARMLEDGLLEEVRRLLDDGVPPDAPGMRAIGYREAVACLRGELDRQDLAERMAIATRQYAKRQDTWLRKEPGITWLEAARTAAELPSLVERAMIATSFAHR